jgi:hypothetical protein
MEHRVNPSSFQPAMPGPRRAGHGCIVEVLALVALGIGLALGINAVFMPWGFYMGGQFHILPWWTGWGRMHSNLAGDYILYVRISPTTGSSHTRPVPHINGQGYLCTPQGEQYRLHVGGDFEKPAAGTNLQGKGAYLYMNNYHPISGTTAPSLEFRGKWNNPDLVLDDHGSITRAFDPGGKLAAKTHIRPYIQEVVPITLHPGSWSEFEAACLAMKR